jgi:hypothetical protein
MPGFKEGLAKFHYHWLPLFSCLFLVQSGAFLLLTYKPWQ